VLGTENDSAGVAGAGDPGTGAESFWRGGARGNGSARPAVGDGWLKAAGMGSRGYLTWLLQRRSKKQLGQGKQYDNNIN
jgi:hypothetical protein